MKNHMKAFLAAVVGLGCLMGQARADLIAWDPVTEELSFDFSSILAGSLDALIAGSAVLAVLVVAIAGIAFLYRIVRRICGRV